MTWQQTLVVAWIQFAVVAAVMLAGAGLAMRWVAQPAERARFGLCALAAVLVIPLLSAIAPLPAWRLGLVSPNGETASSSQQKLVIASGPLLGNPGGSGSATPSRSSRQVSRDSEPTAAPTAVGHASVNSTATLSASAPTADADLPLSQFDRWSLLVAVIVAAHVVVGGWFAAQWTVGRARLRRLRRGAAPAGESLRRTWEAISGRAGRGVRLVVSSEVAAPLMFSWLKPVVVVPQAIVVRGGAALDYCLAHEWSHIDRGDMLAARFVHACQFVLWYQPAFWRVRRELRLCQEFLADHRSTADEGDRIEYSELLVGLAKTRLAAPVYGALNLFDEPSQLGRRVRMLLESGVALQTHCRRRFTGTVLVACALAAAIASMVRIDSLRAEPQPPKNEARPARTIKQDQPQSEGAKPAAGTPSGDKPDERQTDATKTDPTPPGTLTYSGRVTDKTTGKPIAGATVTVRRSNPLPKGREMIAETKHTTDSDGKYTFIIPPKQFNMPRLYIELDVEHPQYASRKGFGYALSMIRKNETLGSRPFFESVELAPADSVTGIVVAPDGKPMPLVNVQGFSKPLVDKRLEHGSFSDTVTDAQGKFRLNFHKGGEGVLWVLPKDFAIVQRMVSKDRGDLGEIRLMSGVRTRGRVTDAAGKPMAGVAVNMEHVRGRDDPLEPLRVSTSVRRGALTDADGRFALGPLPEGEFRLIPEEHLSDPLARDRQIYPLTGVFTPKLVSLKASDEPAEVDLQAVPHVVFDAQYYNSKGAKTSGHEVSIFGRVDGQFWHARSRHDLGHITVLAPHGLEQAQVSLITNEHSSLRYRLGKDQPLKNDRDIQLGTLNDDVTGVEIIRYVAPIVLVQAVDQQQQPIKTFRVAAAYPWGQQRYILEGETRSDVSFERQEDGRQRSKQLLPDEDVTFTAMAEGFEPSSQSLQLAEGDKKELVLVLKAKAEADQPAAKE